MERQLGIIGRADALPAGARHRRVQHLRFRLSSEAGRGTRNAGLLWRFSARGFGEASRLLHRFEREPDLAATVPARLRPVLYNSWEATVFNVNEAGRRRWREKAAKLGVELFVMDDGWFGKRNNDHAGLGDWS